MRFPRFHAASAPSPTRHALAFLSVGCLVIAGAVGAATPVANAHTAGLSSGYRFQDSHFAKLGIDDAAYSDNNSIQTAAAAEAAANRAYPAKAISPAQMNAAKRSFENVSQHWGANGAGEGWSFVGPTTVNTSAAWTYTGKQGQVSGRTTALGVATVCHPGDCRFYLGAAGGGVWRTYDALANQPVWTSVSNGLFTNAIGSIWVDPSNSRHVLVGTGEPNGSSDSEAGYGLFETHNAGSSWSLLSGSYPVAAGRSVASVAVDPANAQHIFIGTAVARHGSSSVNGGRFTPPGAPTVGLYESKNGGKSFSLAFSVPSDVVNPGSPNGSDFFRGGVTNVKFDPTTAGRIYFSIFDYGVYRSAAGGYEQVFASAGGGSPANSLGSRTEFALAPINATTLRIYVGDTDGNTPANLYRVDNANVAATTLTNGTTNPGWMDLSNPVNGTPGFASYDFCGGQCSYDMPVASPLGHPDTVWIGGQMQYNELLKRSNGRAVQRSTTAGVSFTDMTNDATFNGMHPDQHVIIFDPENANIGFAGSDGGLVRTSDGYSNQASDPNLGCSARGLVNPADQVDCQNWLSAVPNHTYFDNAGLATLQFQSVSVNPTNVNDVQGGTQDNGTLLRNGNSTTYTMAVGGDGGQSGFNVADPNIRFHSYYAPQHDVNFKNGDPMAWDWISDPLLASHEAASFYVPIIADPKVGGTMFDGLQHVWRTTDNGGPQAYLDQHCNEFTGDFKVTCGDWQPLGGASGSNTPGDLVGSVYGADKSGSYVVAVTRATNNANTMWAGTRRGRLFISNNANAANPAAVTFTRIDSANTPTRFISGIAVDPKDANHAFVSFSGYNAYAALAGTVTGHVFDVHYNPATGTASWNDISGLLGDQPVTGIAYDGVGHALYIATDYGVLRLRQNGHWRIAAPNMPLVAVYGITLAPQGGVLYAATHGRGIYRLNINENSHGD